MFVRAEKGKGLRVKSKPRRISPGLFAFLGVERAQDSAALRSRLDNRSRDLLFVGSDFRTAEKFSVCPAGEVCIGPVPLRNRVK